MQDPLTRASTTSPGVFPDIAPQTTYPRTSEVLAGPGAEKNSSAPGPAISFGDATSMTGSNCILQSTVSGDLNQYAVTNVYYLSAAQSGPINQLPPPLDNFVGRVKGREKLTRALSDQKPSVGVICSLYGMGGIGKTELAVWVGHAVAAHYPDGVLFIAMHASSALHQRPIIEGLRDAVRPFMREGFAMPVDLASLSGLYRQTLHGRRVLIILDDVQDMYTLRCFTPPAGCGLVVTSRNRLLFDGRSPGWAIPPFKQETAETSFLAHAPHLANDPLLPALLARCDYLPLAVRMASAILAERPNLSLAGYLGQLENPAQQYAALQYHDENVYDIVGITDRQLEQKNPLLATRWRMLHVCGATFPARVVAAIWEEADPNALDEQLTELCRHSLLSYNPKTQHYSMTNILRDIARQRCGFAPAARAIGRYTAFFQRLTHSINKLLDEASQLSHGLAILQETWPHLLMTSEYLQRQGSIPPLVNDIDVVSPAVMLSIRLQFSQIQELQ